MGLRNTKELIKNMNRQLKGRVIISWYFDTELIWLEKDNGQAIDVWSVGCIIGESLYMKKASAPIHINRRPLFP